MVEDIYKYFINFAFLMAFAIFNINERFQLTRGEDVSFYVALVRARAQKDIFLNKTFGLF